jgi:hypothetical protein
MKGPGAIQPLKGHNLSNPEETAEYQLSSLELHLQP